MHKNNWKKLITTKLKNKINKENDKKKTNKKNGIKI
jgi:hypothetical protein